ALACGVFGQRVFVVVDRVGVVFAFAFAFFSVGLVLIGGCGGGADGLEFGQAGGFGGVALEAFGFDAVTLGVEKVLDREDQRLGAFALERGDLEVALDRAVGLEEGGDALGTLFFGNQVELVQCQPARLVVQRLVVLAQFLDDRLGVRDRVGLGVEGGEVDQVQQHVGALQVAQELVA